MGVSLNKLNPMSIETFIAFFVCPYLVASGLYFLDIIGADEFSMFSQGYIVFSWFFIGWIDPPEPPYL